MQRLTTRTSTVSRAVAASSSSLSSLISHPSRSTSLLPVTRISHVPPFSVACPCRCLLKSARVAARSANESKLKRFRPITPSLRHTVLVNRAHLWKGRPVYHLTRGLRKRGGRSRTTGQITVRHRGGGSKRLYRFIDFKRSVLDKVGLCERLEYDPNRSAFIALISYAHTTPNTLKYIVAPELLQPGDTIIASRTKEVDIKPGNALPIGSMPVGTLIHCVELYPGRGAQLARGAGTACTVLDKTSKPGFALIELASKEQRYIPLACMGTVGQTSNTAHNLQSLGKAGRNRNKGWRPTVRGIAMNPVDHPMGGGGGKAKGTHSKSYTGVLAKGYKTRNKRKPRHMIVVPRGGVKKGVKGLGGRGTAKAAA